MTPLALIAAIVALAGCQTDTACHPRNAPSFVPSSEHYRTMSPTERRAQAERYDGLARRCGWEP